MSLRKRATLVSIALFFAAQGVSAQSIRVSLDRIDGVTVLSEHDLRDSLGFLPTKIFLRTHLRDSILALSENVRRLYIVRGHYGVRIDSLALVVNGDSSEGKLSFRINEGRRSVIDSLGFTGNHALTRLQILETIQLRTGDVLDPRELERQIENLLVRYENLGFPFASLTLDSVAFFDSRGLAMHFTIDEGPLVTVRDIVSASAIETSPDVLRRGSGLDLNRPYRQQQIDRVRANLERLEIFSSVSEPVLQMRTVHDAVLAMTVAEANTTMFDAIVGYLPPSGTTQGYFIGSVDVSFLNLLSSARKLGLHWSRKEIAAQDLWVTYHEPWVFGLPVAMDLRVSQHEQDSTFTRRDGSIGASTELGGGFTITGTLSAASTSPGSPTSPISNSTEYDAGFELVYDTRDDAYSPRNGVAYSSHYAAGKKSIAGTSSAIQHVDVNAELDHSLFAQSVAVLAMHGAVVSSSQLDAGDLYRVGGVGSVRGYRDQQFYASRVAWGTVEFRQLIAKRSYLFVFTDGGYYLRSITLDQPTEQSGVLLGYGLGIQTDSPLGLVKVSLALGKGDSFGQAKVHFGVVNRF